MRQNLSWAFLGANLQRLMLSDLFFERRAVLHSSKKEERSPEKLMASWSAANFDELRKFDACRAEPVWLRA
jgi:hypothetical protein